MGGKTSYDPDLRDGALRERADQGHGQYAEAARQAEVAGPDCPSGGRDLYINAGEKSGLQVGTKLDVYRAARPSSIR